MTSCTASGDWSGSRDTSGSEEFGPLTVPQTFTLDCTGPNGDASVTTLVPIKGEGTLTFTDITYAPDDPNQPAFVRVFGLDMPTAPVVRVNGKAQNVLRTAFLNGTDSTYELPQHAGLTQDSLTSDHVGKFYEVIEVELTDVAPGDTTISVDDVDNSLPFEVGATGNVYFISPTGNNSGAGSLADPWANWEAAEANAGPGDVIYFRGGNHTYTNTSDDTISFGSGLSGSPGLPIAAVAYPGEIPVISGDAAVRQSAGYTTVAGFTRTTGGMGAHNSGAVTFETRWVYNNLSGGTHPAGFNFYDLKTVNGFYALGSDLHDAGVPDTGGSGDPEGIYVSGWGENNNVYIDHNHIHDFDGKGFIFVFGHVDGESINDMFIRWNYTHSPAGTGAKAVGIFLGGTDGTVKNWIKDATIVGNTASDMRAGFLVVPPCPAGNGTGRDPTAVVSLQRNVAFDNDIDMQVINVAEGSFAVDNDTQLGLEGGNCNGETFPLSPNLDVIN